MGTLPRKARRARASRTLCLFPHSAVAALKFLRIFNKGPCVFIPTQNPTNCVGRPAWNCRMLEDSERSSAPLHPGRDEETDAELWSHS